MYDNEEKICVYSEAEMTPARVGETLKWIHSALARLLRVYERQEGQIDKEGSVAIRRIFFMFQKSRVASFTTNDGVMRPNLDILSLPRVMGLLQMLSLEVRTKGGWIFETTR